MNIIFILLGSSFVLLGIIGLLLPIVPTTPFLLLAAACFYRSSPRLYSWLLQNRWFGPPIRSYREHNALSMRVKLSAIVVLWCSITPGIVFGIDAVWGKVALMLVAVGVTYYLLSLNTLPLVSD